MSQEPRPLVSRPRILTNSCAEFVEVRAGQAIIERISSAQETSPSQELTSPEFVTAIDGFVPPGEAPTYAFPAFPSQLLTGHMLMTQ